MPFPATKKWPQSTSTPLHTPKEWPKPPYCLPRTIPGHGKSYPSRPEGQRDSLPRRYCSLCSSVPLRGAARRLTLRPYPTGFYFSHASEWSGAQTKEKTMYEKTERIVTHRIYTVKGEGKHAWWTDIAGLFSTPLPVTSPFCSTPNRSAIVQSCA